MLLCNLFTRELGSATLLTGPCETGGSSSSSCCHARTTGTASSRKQVQSAKSAQAPVATRPMQMMIWNRMWMHVHAYLFLLRRRGHAALAAPCHDGNRNGSSDTNDSDGDSHQCGTTSCQQCTSCSHYQMTPHSCHPCDRDTVLRLPSDQDKPTKRLRHRLCGFDVCPISHFVSLASASFEG